MLQPDLIQPFYKEIPFLRVERLKIFVIFRSEIQPHCRRLLKGRRSPHRQKIMDFLGIFDHVLRPHQVSQSPPRDGISLGKRIAGDRPVIQSRKSCHHHMDIRLKNNMLVHFVCDDESVVFLRQRSNERQLLSGEHLSAGIGRIADDNGLRPLFKCLLQLFPVKIKLRRCQRDIDRICSRQNSVRRVIFIEGGKDNHLVSRIADRHHGGHHRLRSPAGHYDLLIRIDLPSNSSAVFSGNGLPDIVSSVGNAVLMGAFFCRSRQSVGDLLRRIKIRKTLG